MLANGHGDELLSERGVIATSLPLAELKQLLFPRAAVFGLRPLLRIQ
jgi:hypothetical protein